MSFGSKGLSLDKLTYHAWFGIIYLGHWCSLKKPQRPSHCLLSSLPQQHKKGPIQTLGLNLPNPPFLLEDDRAQEICDKEVKSLEKVLGVTKPNVDFRREWKSSHPDHEAFTEHFKEFFYDFVVWIQLEERSHSEISTRQSLAIHLMSILCPDFVGTEQHLSSLQSKRQEFHAFIDGIFGDNTIMITHSGLATLESLLASLTLRLSL